MAEKTASKYLGKESYEAIFLFSKEKDIEKALTLQKKQGSIKALKSSVLQALKVFKASRMTRLSKLKQAFKE